MDRIAAGCTDIADTAAVDVEVYRFSLVVGRGENDAQRAGAASWSTTIAAILGAGPAKSDAQCPADA